MAGIKAEFFSLLGNRGYTKEEEEEEEEEEGDSD
jgi:hypothetical protein